MRGVGKIQVVNAEPRCSPPYGLRVGEGDTLEAEPREQATLELIRRLRAMRLSVREIRAQLEDWRVPANGSRWHLTTVARILPRQRAAGLQGGASGSRGAA